MLNKVIADLIALANFHLDRINRLGPQGFNAPLHDETSIKQVPLYAAVMRNKLTDLEIKTFEAMLSPDGLRDKCKYLRHRVLRLTAEAKIAKDDLLTLEEVAALRNIKLTSLRTLVSKRKIKTVLVDRRAHLTTQDLALL